MLDYPPAPFRICDDTTEQERIDILQDMAVRGSSDPGLIELSKIVLNRAKSRDPRSLAEEALNAIHHLEYHSHPPGEWFQPVSYTLRFGGNCEDLSSALVSLLLRLGVKAQVAWISQDDRPLNHVAVQAAVADRWQWADPSIAGARLGRHLMRHLRVFLRACTLQIFNSEPSESTR